MWLLPYCVCIRVSLGLGRGGLPTSPKEVVLSPHAYITWCVCSKKNYMVCPTLHTTAAAALPASRIDVWTGNTLRGYAGTSCTVEQSTYPT